MGDDNAISGSPSIGTCAVAGDDEDGITGAFTTIALVPGDTASPITIDNGSLIDCFLNAWVDFNGDEDWDDADEQIFTDELLLAGSTNPLTFAVPGSAIVEILDTSARFRCSTSAGVTATGTAPDGEVEDYQVDIDVPRDLGDLPDSYGTLLSSNGARHILPAMDPIWLGAIVDAEPTGSPGGAANGDDLEFSDDEDGIVFTPGTWGDGTGEIEATVSGGSGCLIGWVDFDGANGFTNDVPDGFGLVSEHIFTEFLNPGTTTVSFPTPIPGILYPTYPSTLNMRFRFFPASDPLFNSLILPVDGNGCPNPLSTTADMETISRDEASNGEIEDYIQGFGPTAVALNVLPATAGNNINWLYIVIIFLALGLITFILLPYQRLSKR
jgi:hypothetical protein